VLRASLRGIWDHKFRTILLGLAVVAGVSFVSASFIFTDTISQAFDNVFASSAEGLDVNVGATQPEGEFQLQQFRMDASIADQIEAFDGVVDVYRTVFGTIALVVDGDVVPVTGPPQFGQSWTGEIGGWMISEGRAPSAANEVVVDAGLIGRPLTRANPETPPIVELGGTIGVARTGAVSDYEVVGVASFGEEGGTLGATFVFFEPAQAAEILGAVGKLDSIDLTIEPGLDVDTFVMELQLVLPDDVEVRSSQAAAEAQAADLQDGLNFINTFLLVFAGIAVFVGIFVVHNAYRTVIGQRSRELALFRVLGSTRQQVLRSVLAEDSVIGIVASILGVAGGNVLAYVLEGLLEMSGGNLPDGPLQVFPRTVMTAVSVGILTTIASALIPAYRASRISPMAALIEVEKPTRGFDRRRLSSLLLLLGGVTLSVISVLQNLPNPVLALGLVAFVLGAYFIGALLAQPVIGVATRPIQSTVTGDLARQNAQRSPRPTAATAGALMIGVALVTAVAILTVSIQETARAAIEDALTADLVIQQSGISEFNLLAGISEEIAPIVADVDGVEQLTALKGGQAEIDGNITFVAGLDPDTFPDLFSYEDVEGDFANLVGNSIAVQRSKAEEDGLSLGSTVDLAFVGDPEPFGVVAIWDLSGDTNDETNYYIPRATYSELSPAALDLSVHVKISDDADLDSVKARIEVAIIDYPTASVSSQSDILRQIEEQLNGFLILIFGLLGMSVLIALLGVLLTLLLSVFERTREIGLLRAVGMIRSQVRSMVRWESVIVAMFGALLGVGVGLFLGWALGRVIFEEGAVYTIPWVYVIVGFVSAAFAGLIAAWWPARRAASLNILEAIAHE